jgi:hypothetical protein
MSRKIISIAALIAAVSTASLPAKASILGDILFGRPLSNSGIIKGL